MTKLRGVVICIMVLLTMMMSVAAEGVASVVRGKVVDKSSNGPIEFATVVFFTKPDKSLLLFGVVGFCCMVSEGVMFDWSGVYFKEIVKAPTNLIILGYASFMIMMALGRFLGDAIILKYGQKLVLQVSGFLISLGLFSAVFFPFLVPATLAFMLVGIGVSTVVPTLFSIAGKYPKLAPSVSITIVSSVSFMGFLIGPPIIGYIAEALVFAFLLLSLVFLVL